MTTLTSEQAKENLNGHHKNGRSLLDANPFSYGWRTITQTLPDGTINLIDIALTEDDILSPQVGDQMPQSEPHFRMANSVFDRFDKRYSNDPTTAVFCDLKMIWHIPNLAEPCPDIAIVPNVRNKTGDRTSFDVIEEGTRPCLVIEVVSPQYPGDDTKKPDIYARAGVAEYIIIDPHFANKKKDVELIGFRLVEGKYKKIEPDAQGRLLSQSTGMLFAVDKPTRSIRLTDAATGETFLTDLQEYETRQKAETRAAQEAQRAEEAIKVAERESQRADEERQARLALEAENAQLRALLAAKKSAQ